jgi:hypothetical protein
MTIRPSELRHRATQSTARSPMSESARLRLVGVAVPDRDATEHELLAFDPDEDLAALVAMPLTIAAPVRSAITRAVAHRFAFAEDLDDWLHAPNESINGRSPFECVVAGDGAAVLRALSLTRPLASPLEESPAEGASPPRLGLVK